MVNDHGWQDPRNQRAGFQLPVHAASSGCVLRNSRQTWNERTQGVFDESRSEYRQHLRIKRFIGNSENAVKTQIWCAVATYVLIAIVKKGLQIDASL